MFDPLVAANLARCSGDGLELILEPSRGDVLSEVGPEPSAATGDLCPAFERLLGRDREAAEASAWLPGRSWLAAKLFTRLRRFRSGCRHSLPNNIGNRISLGGRIPTEFDTRAWPMKEAVGAP